MSKIQPQAEDGFEEDPGEEIDDPADPVDPVDPVAPGDPICDPLSQQDGGSDNRHGLLGRLTYLDASAPIAQSVFNFWQITSEGLVNPVKPVDISLFSSWINTPTRRFDSGFFVVGEDVPLLREDGQVLYENFSLYYQSNLVLGEAEPGEYEFALLADDGAILKIRGAQANQSDFVINNDGTHPTKMKCSTSKVTLDEDSRFPLELFYHQGPRYHVSLLLMWRKLAPGQMAGQDVMCESLGNSLFFNPNVSPSAPTTHYQQMLNRGWSVVPSSSYLLPGNVTNPCTEP